MRATTGDDAPASAPIATGRADVPIDSRQDDWLGDEAAIEWFTDPGETPRSPEESRGRLRRRDRRVEGLPGETVGLDADVPELYRRRRLVGLVVLLVVVAAAVLVPVVLLGGGGGSSPPATTVAQTTTQTTTASRKPPARTGGTAGRASTGPRLVLPASGTIRTGDTGSAVTQLQQALKQVGNDPGKVDGIFGPLTRSAVSAFQTANGLTTDGIVGKNTTAKLNAALAG